LVWWYLAGQQFHKAMAWIHKDAEYLFSKKKKDAEYYLQSITVIKE